MANDYSDSVCVAYPYVFPQDTNLPIDYDMEAHSTVIYLGDVDNIKASKEEVLKALSSVSYNPTGIVDVSGLELFGPESNILVMTLDSSDLTENFGKVSEALGSIGVENASSFPDYKPHVTLNEDYHGPTIGFSLPTTIGLGEPELWWGSEKISVE